MNTKYNVGQEISTVVEATETICGIKVNTKGAVMYNMKSGKTYTEEALSKNVVEDKPKEEPEQKEPIARLYCVKDCMTCTEKWFTKGNTYDLTAKGEITFDSGWVARTYETLADFKNRNPVAKDCIFPLISRPAKVGETILLIKEPSSIRNRGEYHKNDIVKITHFGLMPSVACNSGYLGFCDDEYLVLDGYQPKEPFKPYLECDGENYGIIGEKTEITAFAETPLNIGDVVEVAKANGYDVFTSVVANLSNGAGIMGYLSTSKNMKNGSFVNPYRERCYVRKIRDYTELKDGETIRGVTAHLTEKGE